jgi:outer membrane biosynthesis protein TonB
MKNMSDRNKNIRLNLLEFFRYIRKELKGRERNSFERELQKDPFSDEALEGFAMLDREDALKDVSELQSRLKNRTNRKGRVAFYRIAASVAILTALSVIFLLTNDTKTLDQIADNTDRKEILEIEKSQPITDSEANKIITKEPETEDSKKDMPVSKNINAGNGKKQEDVRYDLLEQKNADSMEESKSKSAAEAYIEPERRLAPATAVTREKPAVPGDEVTIVGYGKESEAGRAEATENYLPPEPANGKRNFERYVRRNIQKPDSLSPGQTETVVVNFVVTSDGSIDSLIVISSPGKAFSDEAIRLIRSGPVWKPAEKDGNIIEDSVRLSITFR